MCMHRGTRLCIEAEESVAPEGRVVGLSLSQRLAPSLAPVFQEAYKPVSCVVVQTSEGRAGIPIVEVDSPSFQDLAHFSDGVQQVLLVPASGLVH